MPASPQRENEAAPCTLGLDVGSVSVKAVLLDARGQVCSEAWQRAEGRPVARLAALLGELARRFPNAAITRLAVCGSGKERVAKALDCPSLNEIVAHAKAAAQLYPEAQSVIEIGGQDSKYITLRRVAGQESQIGRAVFNELCAAGTGAFLDQQAARLGLGIERFSEMAAKAAHGARVAGRCSVFAKTDMIHLQQRAVGQDEIAYGLCLALARNYLSTLCHGERPPTPILFQGGVAQNQGVARAFRELLNVTDDTEFVRPAPFLVMGALGAGLWANAAEPFAARTLESLALRLSEARDAPLTPSRLAPLHDAPSPPAALPQNDAHEGPFVLGVDVGSTTTKACLLDARGTLVAKVYAPTAGAPIEALHGALAELFSRCAPRPSLVAVTGSGRELAGRMLGADLCIDEINAQAAGALAIDPLVDTVLEIGGQDAKYLSFAHGHLTRFQMNRACAAGTGAFLEEQAGRLKLDIARDFAAAAFSSDTPSQLESRCTVFMDSDLVHHVQHGASAGDLCAGLAYAVARNMLEKVVGARPLGARLLLQGGVARNAAVAAAFAALLARPVAVHPEAEVSGAYGVARLALEERKAGRLAWHAPRDLGDLALPRERSRFVCQGCDNRCEIERLRFASGPDATFGGICGKYEPVHPERLTGENAFMERERLLLAAHPEDGPLPGVAAQGPLVAPFALSMHSAWPFWRSFLSALGFTVTLGGPTGSASLALGLAKAPAPFCLPIKALFGHVEQLLADGTTRLFIPHERRLSPPGEEEPRYACPYTQSAPYVTIAARPLPVLILPYPTDGEEGHFVKECSARLTLPKALVRRALKRAQTAQADFVTACQTAGQRRLARLDEERRNGVVLLGRPYNTGDRLLTLDLAQRLAQLGLEALPFDFLPLATEALPPFWIRVRWNHGRRLLKAARIVKRNPRLSALIVTNFGCGPDAFIDQYLEKELALTPHLTLEFDEQQAAAGLATRLLAFAYTLRKNPPETPPPFEAPDPGRARLPLRELTYYIPNMSDHARAFTGALRAQGCRAVLLPKSDEASWRLGSTHAYGRECHPYVSIMGDLLRLAQNDPDFDPARSASYGPSYFGPCLLPQYMLAMKLVFERVGLGELTVMNLADPSTMSQLGTRYLADLLFGMVAIDRLFRWYIEELPYAANRAEWDQAYAATLADLEEGVAAHRAGRALKAGVARMKAVPRRLDGPRRPAVAVIGDVYTRVNDVSNDRLFLRLIDLGFEVWPAATLFDVGLLGFGALHEDLARKGRPLASAAARLLVPLSDNLTRLVDRHLPPLRQPLEGGYRQTRDSAARYLDPTIDRALSLNLARLDDVAAAGAKGVINAMCHACMLGTVTESFALRIAADYPDLAFTTLIYESQQSTHAANRLEAFAHQVWQKQANAKEHGE